MDSFLGFVSVSDGCLTFARTRLAAEKVGVPIVLFWTLAACGFVLFCFGRWFHDLYYLGRWFHDLYYLMDDGCV